MRRGWRKIDDGLFAAAINDDAQIRYHLLVESLPNDSGWDWTVWRPGDAPDAAHHGIASSAVEAMRAAERAVGN